MRWFAMIPVRRLELGIILLSRTLYGLDDLIGSVLLSQCLVVFVNKSMHVIFQLPSQPFILDSNSFGLEHFLIPNDQIRKKSLMYTKHHE